MTSSSASRQVQTEAPAGPRPPRQGPPQWPRQAPATFQTFPVRGGDPRCRRRRSESCPIAPGIAGAGLTGVAAELLSGVVAAGWPGGVGCSAVASSGCTSDELGSVSATSYPVTCSMWPARTLCHKQGLSTLSYFVCETFPRGDPLQARPAAEVPLACTRVQWVKDPSCRTLTRAQVLWVLPSWSSTPMHRAAPCWSSSPVPHCATLIGVVPQCLRDFKAHTWCPIIVLISRGTYLRCCGRTHDARHRSRSPMAPRRRRPP